RLGTLVGDIALADRRRRALPRRDAGRPGPGRQVGGRALAHEGLHVPEPPRRDRSAAGRGPAHGLRRDHRLPGAPPDPRSEDAQGPLRRLDV
ncbi:MAG: hypothetical protein AVDCRST_MAG16-1737, partial [uncultured Frankineae bacterium]